MRHRITLLALPLALAGFAATAAPALAERAQAPILRITSPVADSAVAGGQGRVGAGSPNGAGFNITLEVVTRDSVGVKVNEGVDIRRADLVGHPNPNFPGLRVTVDTNLITPDGRVLPRGTNLAALFNVAGTDDTPGPGVTVWTGWHVLESLPAGVQAFTLRSSVRDELGRVARDAIRVQVHQKRRSGQALTPPPGVGDGDGRADRSGPDVQLIAPRVPTSVAIGPKTPVPPAGALFFLQVTALDRARHGIGVSENGPGTGTIIDPTQIALGLPNRFYPGLRVTFDVALLTPTGLTIAAGTNLAPVFNIAGSEIEPGGLIRTTADWTVGGSLVLPEGKHFITITAKVTDLAGKTGVDRVKVDISRIRNGQNLTPNA